MPQISQNKPYKYKPSILQNAGCISIVILGASGDLAKRKLYPAFFSLMKEGFLPENCNIIGYARSKLSKEELVQRITPFSLNKGATKEEEALFEKFLQKCHYVSGKYDKDEDFQNLNNVLSDLESKCQMEVEEKIPLDENLGSSSNTTPSCSSDGDDTTIYGKHRMFFLSLPPDVFLTCATKIGQFCRTKVGWNRIVIEKPFGRDLKSFEVLSKGLNSVFSQDEIFRIDHYIGKEVVQNLLVLRFANVIFDPLWNRSNIKSVQIIFKEQLGVEGRGGYFDNYGIIRDVMQNHLMQILSLIAMEPPVSLKPEDISIEKIKVLKSIAPLKLEDVVTGQYSHKNISGKEYAGYTDDPTVDPNSITPTFAACVLKIRNRRWDGVPFLMKCGKALDDRIAEIRVQFHDVPANLYSPSKASPPNELVIRIQPDEAIYFKIMNKVVGFGEKLTETQLDFTYKSKYTTQIPDAYARLLLDVMEGKSSNFIKEEELRISWEIFTPLLEEFEKNHISPENYSFGSRGPVEADYLAAKFNVKWCEGI